MITFGKVVKEKEVELINGQRVICEVLGDFIPEEGDIVMVLLVEKGVFMIERLEYKNTRRKSEEYEIKASSIYLGDGAQDKVIKGSSLVREVKLLWNSMKPGIQSGNVGNMGAPIPAIVVLVQFLDQFIQKLEAALSEVVQCG